MADRSSSVGNADYDRKLADREAQDLALALETGALPARLIEESISEIP